MTHEAPSSTGNAVRPPDGGWGWVVVFASFMINVIGILKITYYFKVKLFICDFCIGGGFACTLGIFLVEFKTHFGEGSEATSWISSILAGVTLGSGNLIIMLLKLDDHLLLVVCRV